MKEQLEFVTYGRKGTNCVKWDEVEHVFGKKDVLPLWIADMDIKTPKVVREALAKAAEDGVFGYYHEPDAYYESFIQWESKRLGYEATKESIRVLPGIVPALFWAVQMYTQPEDACIALTPSYGPFLNSITNNDRTLICCELVNTDGYYTVDFADFEEKIVQNQVKMFLQCSPHNPTGRVWSREELTQLFDICKKHDVFIVSDEIHQDVIPGTAKQIPAPLVVGDYAKLVILTAGSKTFNLASAQNAMAIIPNEETRKTFDDFVAKLSLQHGNRFGYEAIQAAYTGGEAWLEEVLELLRCNHKLLTDTLAQRAPKVVVTPQEGMYLAWADFGAYLKPEEVRSFMIEKCGVGFNYADMFYPKGSLSVTSHVRINLATSTELLQEALDLILTQLEQLA